MNPDGYWSVTCADKSSVDLSYEEMIGVVISLSLPEQRPCLRWMKTKQEHEAFEKHMQNLRAESNHRPSININN